MIFLCSPALPVGCSVQAPVYWLSPGCPSSMTMVADHHLPGNPGVVGSRLSIHQSVGAGPRSSPDPGTCVRSVWSGRIQRHVDAGRTLDLYQGSCPDPGRGSCMDHGSIMHILFGLRIQVVGDSAATSPFPAVAFLCGEAAAAPLVSHPHPPCAGQWA